MDKTISIGSLIQTQAERVIASDAIDALIANIYHLKGDTRQILSTLSPVVGDLLNNILKKDFGDLAPEDKEKLFLKIKKDLERCPLVGITLAFRPDEVFMSQLGTWIKKEVDSEAIIDISVDRNILGGAIINFQGHYKDISIKRKLNEYFYNKRH